MEEKEKETHQIWKRETKKTELLLQRQWFQRARKNKSNQPTNQPTADIVVWLENIEQVSDA